nr:MAG TPA: hypothetical protein [Caudoviricetes sp.]
MYRDKKKITVDLEFEYEYESDIDTLINVLKQILEMKALKSIDYTKEK